MEEDGRIEAFTVNICDKYSILSLGRKQGQNDFTYRLLSNQSLSIFQIRQVRLIALQ